MSWPVSLTRYPPRRPRGRPAGRRSTYPPRPSTCKQVDADLVLVEGAGGLLVRYDPAGTTIADLAAMLGAPVLVVTAAGARHPEPHRAHPGGDETRRLALAGVVIGAWPPTPI